MVNLLTAFGCGAALTLCGSVVRADPGVSAGSPQADGTTPTPHVRIETRPRTGLLIAGAITTGAGVVHILAGLQSAPEDRDTAGVDDPDYTGIFYVIGGIHLAAGLPMLGFALLDEKEIYVHEQEASLHFAPYVGPKGVGGSLSLKF